jgi:hypothetical protein
MSAAANSVDKLVSLEKRWGNFGLSTREKKILDAADVADFNELVRMTIEAHLDVSTGR